jgi:hypothetical protein
VVAYRERSPLTFRGGFDYVYGCVLVTKYNHNFQEGEKKGVLKSSHFEEEKNRF